jgi:hypothetical protein
MPWGLLLAGAPTLDLPSSTFCGQAGLMAETLLLPQAEINPAACRPVRPHQGRQQLNRAGFAGGSTIWKDGAMGTKKPSKPCPAELRERAVRLVREPEGERASQAAAIRSIAEKVGCSRETLRSIAARSTGAPGRARSRAARRPGHR